MSRGSIKTQVKFNSIAEPVVQAAERGIGVLVLLDDTAAVGLVRYKSLDQVTEAEWTADNYKQIKDFLTVRPRPNELIVFQLPVSTTDIISAIDPVLRDEFFNYMAIPAVAETGKETWNALLEAWIIARTEDDDVTKVSVYIAYNTTDGDHPQVINWTQGDFVEATVTYSGEMYLGKTMGYLCGVSGNEESINAIDLTGQDIEEGTTLKADPNQSSLDGELFIVKRNGKFEYSRGVNSLVTLLTPFESEDYQLIDVFDELMFISNSVVISWELSFKGKKKNTYTFKMQFIDSVLINLYGPEERNNLLDPDADNTVELDLEQHIPYILAKGLDPNDLTELEIKTFNTGTDVFIKSMLRPTTAATDLYYNIFV